MNDRLRDLKVLIQQVRENYPHSPELVSHLCQAYNFGRAKGLEEAVKIFMDEVREGEI